MPARATAELVFTPALKAGVIPDFVAALPLLKSCFPSVFICVYPW
jgi:hypothetical protein